MLAWKKDDRTIALVDGASASGLERDSLTQLVVSETATASQVADWLKDHLS